MSSVIINTTGFPKKYPLVFWNNDTGHKEKEIMIKAEEVAEYIAADPSIEELSLFGLKDYNEGLRQHIEELIAKDYSNHDIEIEVM